MAQIRSSINDAFQRRHIPGKFSFSAQLERASQAYVSPCLTHAVSTGELLPRSHQDHPVQSERGISVDLHQRGPRVHHAETQHPAGVRLFRRSAQPHGLCAQHAVAEMQLKTFEDRETFKTLKDENESDEVVEEVKWITSS